MWWCSTWVQWAWAWLYLARCLFFQELCVRLQPLSIQCGGEVENQWQCAERHSSRELDRQLSWFKKFYQKTRLANKSIKKFYQRTRLANKPIQKGFIVCLHSLKTLKPKQNTETGWIQTSWPGGRKSVTSENGWGGVWLSRAGGGEGRGDHCWESWEARPKKVGGQTVDNGESIYLSRCTWFSKKFRWSVDVSWITLPS